MFHAIGSESVHQGKAMGQLPAPFVITIKRLCRQGLLQSLYYCLNPCTRSTRRFSYEAQSPCNAMHD
eukprot:scaffold110041_cov15-Tisochrysis_lutea.AAC.1